MQPPVQVAIQEDKNVRDFWRNNTLALPRKWSYRNWRNQVEKHKNFVPPEAEAIAGLPDHFLYPLSRWEYVFYEVKLLSLESNVFLVRVKQILTAPEILKVLPPLLQQQASPKEMAATPKIGEAIARLLTSPQCKAVSRQLLKILLPLIAGLSASFVPQFIPNSTNPLPQQQIQPIQQESSLV